MKGKSKGGGVEEGVKDKDTKPSMVYAGKDSNVVKEAEERKRGGRSKKKDGGAVDGFKHGGRADRRPRASGGRTGSENRPMSGAQSTSERPGAKMAAD
jgi:hypothetical protein